MHASRLHLALIALLFSLVHLPLPARAQLSAQMQESTVRILCPQPPDNGGSGFNVVHIRMPTGDTVDIVNSSFGTGFVINNEGYIMTNNHVVAPDPSVEVPEKLVMVVQKVGRRFILHKARVLWQSANRDVAVIQCPQLRATPLPLLFDESQSTASEEVYSMGFPGITDVAEENFSRADEIRKQLVLLRAQHVIDELQQKLRRRLTQAEINSVVGEVNEQQGPVSAERNELMAALDSFLRLSDTSTGYWDVTNVMDRKNLWKDYFSPTVTKGNIEKIAKRHGILGVSYPDVLTIQHSCAVKHGNSGGPLLNAGGQVIGVVGRGNSRIANGERESIEWATAIGETKDWLDTNSVHYTLAGEWRKPIAQRLPVKIVVAISLAVAAAIVALLLGLLKFNQKPTLTTILRDPRLAKVLGTTESQLRDLQEATPFKSTPGSLPGFGKWQLVGRTPNGDDLRLEIPDIMFVSNSNRLVLGRTAELCHLVVNDGSVSRQHAQIRKDGVSFFVADRNSSNKTAVNGQFNRSAFDEVPLKEGDTLTLGEVKLDFSKV